MFFCKFINAPGTTEYIPPASQATPRPCKQAMKRLEGTMAFELKNNQIKIEKCTECHENIMNMLKSPHDINKGYICDSCKDLPSNYYEAMSL